MNFRIFSKRICWSMPLELGTCPFNRPFPSWPCASVSKRVHMQNLFNIWNEFGLSENEHAIRTWLHMNGFTLRLVFAQRQKQLRSDLLHLFFMWSRCKFPPFFFAACLCIWRLFCQSLETFSWWKSHGMLAGQCSVIISFLWYVLYWNVCNEPTTVG